MASIILVTYAATDLLGGNGYLALYILGIYLGNMEFKGKRNIMFFFDGFTEIMQIGLFSSWVCCPSCPNSLRDCRGHLLLCCL